ncbi:uncharacterized protein BJ171DRAFT_211046 [Polychytrium aggregatum]|uniref:uncharacterized protein n=1 Tax=Polychytrium aggregatum TaxID=110093 RepID=UPI0022FE6D47|nr:uncharacterized protein BJ171DRAFT_211046 [Polychytrium aggregatum]KAI9208611.1 hypothetical protein BJ171DRAFT_211046 [Polychytrium aggregatum]
MNVSDARAIRASQNLHTDSFSKPEGRALSTAEMYPANQNISGTVYSSEEVVGKNYVERGAQMYVTFDAYRFITNRILNMNAYSINTLENYYNILLEKRNMDDLQRRERVVRRLSGLERRANELSVECKKLFEARCALEKEMVGVQKKWETTIQILRELMLMNTHLAELKVQYKPERIRGSQYLGSHASMYSGSNMNLGKGTSSQSQLEGFGSTGAALSRRKKESDSPSSHAGGLASGFNISGSRQGSYSHSRQNSVQYSRPSSRQGSRVGSRRQSIIGELDNIQEQASRANLKG